MWPLALRALLAVAVVGVPAACSGGKVQVNNSSEIMAQSLRRELMKDNYDYTSAESEEEEEPQYRPAAEQSRGGEAVTNHEVIVANVLDGEDMAKYPVHYIDSHKKKKNKRRRNLFQKLIKRRMRIQKHMYGSDGEKHVDTRHSSMYRYNMVDDDSSSADRVTEQTTTVKYKILKLRPHRRSGRGAALIQEESPQGVALVRLGGGPIPALRLAGPRRQYMAAPGPPDPPPDYDYLPPPPVDRSVSDEAPPDPDPVTQTTTRHPEHYFNNGNDSLKITVTPDEIFVL